MRIILGKAPPTSFIERSKRNINLNDFSNPIHLDDLCIGAFDFGVISDFSNYLRIPICQNGHDFFIPDTILPFVDFILSCFEYQRRHLTPHPYWYLTVRYEAENERSSLWHVDGFSMRYPHVPETNYIYCSAEPTIFYQEPIYFPENFDGKKHHIHQYIAQEVARSKTIFQRAKPGKVYLLDPYMPHKRPDTTTPRLFVRLTNVPIQIEDDHFTENPLLPVNRFQRIGRDIADQFENYKKIIHPIKMEGICKFIA